MSTSYFLTVVKTLLPLVSSVFLIALDLGTLHYYFFLIELQLPRNLEREVVLKNQMVPKSFNFLIQDIGL